MQQEDPLNIGLELVRTAIEHDQAQRIPQAIKQYDLAINYLTRALQGL